MAVLLRNSAASRGNLSRSSCHMPKGAGSFLFAQEKCLASDCRTQIRRYCRKRLTCELDVKVAVFGKVVGDIDFPGDTAKVIRKVVNRVFVGLLFVFFFGAKLY